MMLKKYLTEVAFINGSEEFKSFRNYTKTVTVGSGYFTSVRIPLTEKEVDLASISVELQDKYDIPVYWRKVNGEATNTIEAYVSDSNLIVEGDVLILNYTGLNEAASDLYSVDYESGVLYLSTPTNVELTVDYKFYNTLLKGKKATQLEDEDYNTTDIDVSIDNFRQDATYSLIYNVKQNTTTEYTTPILTNIKVNYINTSESETF